MVRRSMSETLPVKRSSPSSEESTASTGSSCRSRARRSAAPIRRARLTEPSTAKSLISRPVRGRLHSGGDGADFGHRHPAEPFLPLPARRPLHDHDVVPDIREAEREVPQVRDGEGGHLRLGKGAAHAIGVQHRQPGARPPPGSSGARSTPPISSDITAANGRPSRSASTRTGRAAISGSGSRSSTDQRRAHRGDHRHQIVVGERLRRQQPRAKPPLRLGAQVQQRVVRIATAPRPEDPGAGGEVLELGRPQFPPALDHPGGDAKRCGRPPEPGEGSREGPGGRVASYCPFIRPLEGMT